MSKNLSNQAHRPSPSPSPRPSEKRKVALVVGRYGVGLAIATELAKTMDVAITFGHNAEGAERVAHEILAREDVRQ